MIDSLSGPLDENVSEAIKKGNLVCCGVLSGNRNFEGRIHPDTRANYLASPPLVIAYAIAGRIDIDFKTEPVRLFIHTRIPPSYSRKFQFITYLLSIYHSLDTTQKTSLFSCVTFGRREMSCKQWRKSSSFQGFSKRSIQKSPPVMNAGTSLKCPLAKTTNGKRLPPTSSGRHFLKVRNPCLCSAMSEITLRFL